MAQSVDLGAVLQVVLLSLLCTFLHGHALCQHRRPDPRLKPALPAKAASASSGFGRDSAPMSMFPGSAITAIVVTSASDSVSEPSTVGMPRGGSFKPSVFVAESASSILTNDKSRTWTSGRGEERGPNTAELGTNARGNTSAEPRR